MLFTHKIRPKSGWCDLLKFINNILKIKRLSSILTKHLHQRGIRNSCVSLDKRMYLLNGGRRYFLNGRWGYFLDRGQQFGFGRLYEFQAGHRWSRMCIRAHVVSAVHVELAGRVHEKAGWTEFASRKLSKSGKRAISQEAKESVKGEILEFKSIEQLTHTFRPDDHTDTPGSNKSARNDSALSLCSVSFGSCARPFSLRSHSSSWLAPAWWSRSHLRRYPFDCRLTGSRPVPELSLEVSDESCAWEPAVLRPHCDRRSFG